MKKVLSILVVVLALTLALGCFAYADEFGGAGYEEAAYYKLTGTDLKDVTSLTPAFPTIWYTGSQGEALTFDHYEVISKPTCAVTGKLAVVLKDSAGNPTMHEIEIEKTTDHTFVLVADKDSTCGEKGTGHYECKTCGLKNGVTVELKYVDHDFGEWMVKKAATCTQKGVDYRICRVCLKTEERDSAAKGHEKEEKWKCIKVITEPTCHSDGWGTFVCPRCNGEEDDPVGTAKKDKAITERPPHNWGELQTVTPPTCEGKGKAKHQCMNEGCTETEELDIPALGHTFLEQDIFKFEAWPATCTAIGCDYYVCTRCGLGGTTYTNDYGQKTDLYPSPEFSSVFNGYAYVDTVDFSKNTNKAVKIVVYPPLGHDLNDWNVVINPTEETNNKGYWTKTCKRAGCTYVEEFKGTQAEFDAYLQGKEEAAHANDKNGLINEDGEWKYYKDDVFQSDFVGMVEQDGNDFFVADGKVCMDANGLNMYEGEWYFLSLGRVCKEHTGLALYDGCWFFITDGKLDTSVTGLVDYNGGTFVFADGRLIAEYSGLYFDGTDWYFAANGQIQKDFSGSVEYDGETFVLENGKLVG